MRFGKLTNFLTAAVFTGCGFMLSAQNASARKGDGAAGKQSFTAICASCHGQTGMGDGIVAAALNPKPRDLSDAEYLSTLTDEYLFKVISEGGMSVGKSAMMPAWGGVLGEEGGWNVIAYIREEICKCEYAPIE